MSISFEGILLLYSIDIISMFIVHVCIIIVALWLILYFDDF